MAVQAHSHGFAPRFSSWVPLSVLESLRGLRSPGRRGSGCVRRGSVCSGGGPRRLSCLGGSFARRYSSVCERDVARAVGLLDDGAACDTARSEGFSLEYDPVKAQAFVPEPLNRSPYQSGSDSFEECGLLPTLVLAPTWEEVQAQSALAGDLLRHGLPLHEVIRARERFVELWTVYTMCMHSGPASPASSCGDKSDAGPEYQI
jgi:hypothetical protein